MTTSAMFAAAITLIVSAGATPGIAVPEPDLPSEVSGELPEAVADSSGREADPAGRKEGRESDHIPATPSDAVRQAENQRAVSHCLSTRGVPAETCRQRRPNSEVPMSRTEARRLEQRYRAPAPGSARSALPSSGYRSGYRSGPGRGSGR